MARSIKASKVLNPPLNTAGPISARVFIVLSTVRDEIQVRSVLWLRVTLRSRFICPRICNEARSMQNRTDNIKGQLCVCTPHINIRVAGFRAGMSIGWHDHCGI